MTDPKRPAVDQEPWDTALGTRERRATPWPFESSVRLAAQVADYARAQLPTRGLMYLGRFQRGASGGASHTFVRFRSPIGFTILQIISQGSAANGGGLHMTNGPGAGEASNLALDITNAMFLQGRTGTGDIFNGLTFGFGGPNNPDILSGDTGFCGQVGGFLVPDSPQTAVGLGGVAFAEWYGKPYGITVYPGQDITFITRLANVAFDASFLIEFPLLRQANAESF